MDMLLNEIDPVFLLEWALLCSIMVVASYTTYTDISHREIPNSATWTLLGLGLVGQMGLWVLGEFAESQKRRRSIAHIAKKNDDPKLYLIEFWFAALWPDSFVPEEMRLNSLMAFHETHQTISTEEMAERALMLSLHPLRKDVGR